MRRADTFVFFCQSFEVLLLSRVQSSHQMLHEVASVILSDFAEGI